MTLVAIKHIEIRDGKARIVGSRLSVQNIAVMHVWNETPLSWIAEHYDLALAQIHAALSYYYDHQDEIDTAVREAEALAHEVGVSADELLAEMRSRNSADD